MGARSKPPPRPEFIGTFEMYKKFNKLPYEGGLADQPYLWVIEYMFIEAEIDFMEKISAQSQPT